DLALAADVAADAAVARVRGDVDALARARRGPGAAHADPRRADRPGAAGVAAGAAVLVVGVDGDAGAGAVGEARRTDAARGDARAAAAARHAAGAAAGRVAGQVDAALAARGVRRAAAAHARSRLTEAGAAGANVAAGAA